MRSELLTLLGGLFSASDSSSGDTIQSRTVQVVSEGFNYQLHIPAKLQNKGSLPVIVFLHGIGERGTGGFVPGEGVLNALIRHYFKQIPAIMLLPQCRPGKYWSDTIMEQMVMKSLEQTIEEFGADINCVYLIGVSMGGYGVWHFASQCPGKFAALVSICGGSPIVSGDRFFSIAQKVGKTPSWLFHGADDRVVPVSESREMVKALQGEQGNVKYSEYAGVAHDVWLNALAEKELLPWLLAQRLR